ncbi:TPA: hypothetical protein SCR64_004309 [Enterobacter kobei]|nr:hypothetical protein [Enterobacter kobei]
MSDLSIKRVADFVRCPLEHPLTRGEQMELAQFFLEIQEQIATFKALPENLRECALLCACLKNAGGRPSRACSC